MFLNFLCDSSEHSNKVVVIFLTVDAVLVSCAIEKTKNNLLKIQTIENSATEIGISLQLTQRHCCMYFHHVECTTSAKEKFSFFFCEKILGPFFTIIDHIDHHIGNLFGVYTHLSNLGRYSLLFKRHSTY